jgi:hypothetical protein
MVEKYHVRYLKVRNECPKKATMKRTAPRIPTTSEGR